MANWLKAQMDNAQESITVKQEFGGQAKGDRFLPQSVIESLLLCEETAPQIRHTQITLKKADDNQVILEIGFIANAITEAWRDWLSFWLTFTGTEHVLQIKEWEQKENHILQLQFSFLHIGG